MFTTKEAILETTGVEVDQPTLATAQMMIEAYVGKSEQDVVDGSDRSLLGMAVTFQAIYINGNRMDILEQVAVKSQVIGETTTSFNLDLLAPFMSPWAAMTCKRLSWAGTRSVYTGRMTSHPVEIPAWERD